MIEDFRKKSPVVSYDKRYILTEEEIKEILSIGLLISYIPSKKGPIYTRFRS